MSNLRDFYPNRQETVESTIVVPIGDDINNPSTTIDSANYNVVPLANASEESFQGTFGPANSNEYTLLPDGYYDGQTLTCIYVNDLKDFHTPYSGGVGIGAKMLSNNTMSVGIFAPSGNTRSDHAWVTGRGTRGQANNSQSNQPGSVSMIWNGQHWWRIE